MPQWNLPGQPEIGLGEVNLVRRSEGFRSEFRGRARIHRWCRRAAPRLGNPMAPQKREKAELSDLMLAGNYFPVFRPYRAGPNDSLGIRGARRRLGANFKPQLLR